MGSGQSIQSVEIAASILRALADDRGAAAALKTIAARTDLHPSKAHRYLASLSRSGLVCRDELNGRYKLGPLAIQIGLTGLRNNTPVKMLTRQLGALRDSVCETVVLAIWGSAGPTVIAIEESDAPITMNIKIGAVLPVESTAIGRVFLAFARRSRGLELPDNKNANTAHADIAMPPAVVADIRSTGLAAMQGSLIPGVNALAAPVFDYRSELAAVVGVIGAENSLRASIDTPQGEKLKTWADNASQTLGAPDFAQILGAAA